MIDRPKSEQCNILLGTLLFNRESNEFEHFHVMNHILGGGSSGRLFMMLREEKGYTYGAYSAMLCYKETGGWQATAEVRTEVAEAAIDTFFKQFEKIQHDFVTDEELKNAQRFLIGSFPIKNETPASLASLELQKRL
ncbi:insulinase family protein, partial [Candidatus Saccharibacteria bacterium]|nr:insulinase family protein [Candidatus Saccharibacteria bacterium]NIW78518.1 insulinase family protein [Calditrichia bacterium]